MGGERRRPPPSARQGRKKKAAAVDLPPPLHPSHSRPSALQKTHTPTKTKQTYKRRGLYNIKKKNGGKFPATAKKAKKEAAAPKKTPRFYPADDEPKPLAHRAVHKPTKLRASITPGTVLILLAGRFKGKRVVFLSQLPSGLLLVAGPFSVNGVPARRVNQRYVIATSTKVSLPKLDLSKLTDDLFKATEAKAKKKGADDFFEAGRPDKKAPLSADYVAAQKALDSALAGAVPADLKGYLGARFTLRDGDRPHLMKF
jgi:large subunit ribosomal protein L6e